jgi:hypothetical protein
MEKKLKHLEMVQGVINRMASNSFLLKGWSVILISALFALAAKDSNIYFVYLAYFPAIAFCSLDGFFLRQERLYRKLYDKVRIQKEEEIDFSMNTTEFQQVVQSWFRTCFSPTLRIFHGAIIGTVIIVMIISLSLNGC